MKKYNHITQSKEWFEQKYLNDHLSCKKIADLIGGVTRQGVWKKLNKLGIPIRSNFSRSWRTGKECRVYQGYGYYFRPHHPRALQGRIKRSILILEQKIGRVLKDGEMVHHIDGNKLNDHPDNLEITNRSKHMKDHNPILFRWNNKLNGNGKG